MAWIKFGWAEYLRDRSAVAGWIINNKIDGDDFRLRAICWYRGKKTDPNRDKTFDNVDRKIDIKTAHRITYDLIQMDVLIPTVNTNKVERLVISKSGKEKKLAKLVGWRFLTLLSFFFKWLYSKIKDISIWLITILATLGVKDFFQS